MKLEEYNYKVTYRPGTQVQDEKKFEAKVFTVTSNSHMREEQHKDEVISRAENN